MAEYINNSRYTSILADYLGVEISVDLHAGVTTETTTLSRNDSLLHRALALYPPTSHSQGNIDRVVWFESDKFLCATRRNLKLYARVADVSNKRVPGGVGAGAGREKAQQFFYRFNYWFQSNKTCTAESNYHGPALGCALLCRCSVVVIVLVAVVIVHTNH